MKKGLLLIGGFLLLISIEVLKSNYIFSLPGGQQPAIISLAYFVSNNTWWLRLLAIIITEIWLWYYLVKGKRQEKIALLFGFLFYGLIFCVTNFSSSAQLSYQPKPASFIAANTKDLNKNALVIGIELNGQAKAYPVEIINQRSQIEDYIGNQPVLISYSSRHDTGFAFCPIVEGRFDEFKLAGSANTHPILIDKTTKSWWQSSTGKAVTGPLKGAQLSKIPAYKMTLKTWLSLHPDSLVLQTANNFKKSKANKITG